MNNDCIRDIHRHLLLPHLGQGVAFVGMESSLHKHDTDPVQHAKEKSGLVTGHGGDRKVGNVLVLEHIRIVEEIGETS